MTDSPIINLCNTSRMMSFCDGKGITNDQEKCKFYIKSSVTGKCQHYFTDYDGHCGSADAQREARK